MVEHVLSVKPRINHAAVVPEEVKEGMDGVVDNFHVDIVPEYFLPDARFQEFPGHAHVTHLSRFSKLFKDLLVIFSKIVEKGRAHARHLGHGHLDDPEQGLDGIVRLLNEPVRFFGGPVLIILYDLQKQGIFILEAFVYGPFGYAHLLGKCIHGHGPDAKLSEQLTGFYDDSFSDLHRA